MKRLITYVLMCALMFSCTIFAFAAEVKEIVIDTEVPIFDDLKDGSTYSNSKEIYIADLSETDCIVLKKGTGTVSFNGKTFSGYTEVIQKNNLNCINYVRVATISEEGSYMVYAIDKYGHDIAVRFSVTKPKPEGGGGAGGGAGGSSGGGAGGVSGGNSGGGGSTGGFPVVVQPRESLVKDVLECDEHIVYMTGYPDGSFLPNNNMTRAEVTAMFARLMKEKMDDNQNYASDFSDVDDSMWFANYVGYMQKFNVINGYEDGTFRPNNSITRAEFVTIACRFVKNMGNNSSEFNDITPEHWAYPYVSFAAVNNWVTGYEDGSFKPESTITRAEAVVIVNRMLLRSADKSYIDNNTDKVIKFVDVTNSHWAYYNVIEATTQHQYIKNDNNEKWN